MAMTPDLAALVTSDRKRKLGEVGFNTIGSPRIADNFRRGIASPLLARSEAVHLRGSSCPIIYTKMLVLSVCSLLRIPYPHQIAQFCSQSERSSGHELCYLFGCFVGVLLFRRLRCIILCLERSASRRMPLMAVSQLGRRA